MEQSKKRTISLFSQIPAQVRQLLKRFSSSNNSDSLKVEQTRRKGDFIEDDFIEDDLESGEPEFDRFVYNPKSFAERLAVGAFVKNKLGQSKCITIRYRRFYKYMLAIILTVIGAMLTPQLLPRWLGFEWASPKDLCQHPEEKLLMLHHQIKNMTKLPELRHFLERQKFYQKSCMEKSASTFYQRPDRFEWPDECTPEKAGADLVDEVCVGPETRSSCESVGGLKKVFASLSGVCKKVTVPKRCETVVDGKRSKELLKLEREEAALKKNETQAVVQPVAEASNEKVSYLMNKLLLQIDIASDVYILYSIIAVLVGTPLVIYKREKKTRLISATLGMNKPTFIVALVVCISIAESFTLLMREVDTKKLFRNLSRDPCYVDKEFSERRLEMIMDACNNVSDIGIASTRVLEKMDETYFLSRRFALCHNPKETHPNENDMEKLRERYRDGDLMYPGSCNITELDEKTSTAPQKESLSKLKALLGGGIVGQLLLKVILASWLVHLFAFFEPMILHSGKVEIWNSTKYKTSLKGEEVIEEEVALSERETKAIVSFARDKHLLPLIILNFMMALEVLLIIYSIATTGKGDGEVFVIPKDTELPLNFSCPFTTA